MKKLLITLGLALIAGAAYAGGLSDAITETVPIMPAEDAAPAEGSLPSWVIPAAIIAVLIGVAVASGDDDDDDDDDGGQQYALR